MARNAFFNESKEQSIIKATIVTKYFLAWAQVIIGAQKKTGNGDRIAYIDLFSGPGRYQDGTQSTPIMVLEHAVSDPELQKRLVTIFNDKDEENVQSLREAINELPDIDSLQNQPQIFRSEVGDEVAKMLEGMNSVPTFFFVDPFGYKGLSLQLINSVVKNWGSDCVFFFNYNRINMAITNEAVEPHMIALFGEQRIRRMQTDVKTLVPAEREAYVVEQICEALQEMGGKYVLPFCFKASGMNRTSHYLIFVSKKFRGYDIMKEVMAKESSQKDQGVPSLEYSPATERQPFLFELTRPLDELQQMLLDHFKGRTLTMSDVYQEHSVGRRFIKTNYKQALLQLEVKGLIQTDRPKRKKGTIADDVQITFPST